jgi:hypothetical protein
MALKWLTKLAWDYTLKNNKDAILEYNRIQENKPVTHKDLKYIFTDSDKKRYYGFEDAANMPKERFDKLQEYLTFMSAGLTSEELNKLLDVAERCVEGGIVKMDKEGKFKNAMRLVAILQEIRNRQNIISPTELSYNYLAVQYVREDENPLIFDNEIQLQKVAKFKEDAESSHRFFFRLPELGKLLKLLNMSKKKWKEYSKKWEEERERLAKVTEIYSSQTE